MRQTTFSLGSLTDCCFSMPKVIRSFEVCFVVMHLVLGICFSWQDLLDLMSFYCCWLLLWAPVVVRVEGWPRIGFGEFLVVCSIRSRNQKKINKNVKRSLEYAEHFLSLSVANSHKQLIFSKDFMNKFDWKYMAVNYKNGKSMLINSYLRYYHFDGVFLLV